MNGPLIWLSRKSLETHPETGPATNFQISHTHIHKEGGNRTHAFQLDSIGVQKERIIVDRFSELHEHISSSICSIPKP